MNRRSLFALGFHAIFLAGIARGQTLTPEGVPDAFQHLRKAHPRLLFTSEDQARVLKLAANDAFLKELIRKLTLAAEAKLNAPTVEYKLIGPRLLTQSRNCISTVMTCAMAYRLTGDARFAERTKKELLAAAALPDWHPPHFLDVAEMTAAVAVGYDWIYDYLTPEERATIRTAIVKFGLEPSKKFYPDKGWATVTYNWNQVCNGGMTLGTLAIAEDEPAISQEIVTDAVRSIPKALASYKPDGLWVEGPAYWDYATSYSALFIAALQSALGTDGGFPAMPGFNKTASFFIQTIGPNGLDFNYADVGNAKVPPSATLFWLGRTFHEPLAASFQRGLLGPVLKSKSPKVDRFFALNIAWYSDLPDAPLKQLPLDALFHGGCDLVTMRSAWEDDGALFVGFKGGNNAANHAHLDIGTFVLDANGQRWAEELGSDDYNLPGYFDKKTDESPRWKIYRLNTRSQNTLLINDRNQPESAAAKIVTFRSGPHNARAVADMTAAYAGQVGKALRGISMEDRSRVLVQDELAGFTAASTVRWGMVTAATVTLDGARALLALNGAQMKAEILEPAGAKFQIVPTTPGDPKQNQNAGSSMLAVSIPAAEKQNLRIAVLLTPSGGQWAPLPPPVLKGLAAW